MPLKSPMYKLRQNHRGAAVMCKQVIIRILRAEIYRALLLRASAAALGNEPKLFIERSPSYHEDQ